MIARIRPVSLLVLATLSMIGGWERNLGRAQDADSEAGIFLTVQNPITSEETNRIREKVERAVRERRVAKIVFDFNPDGKEAAARDFGPCHDLAKHLNQLHQLTTVAFVHKRVT